MPPVAPTVAPVRPPVAPLSEVDMLRTQVAELKAIMQAVAPGAVSAVEKAKREEPRYARAPWEEAVFVETTIECYYPEPGDTYAVCRKGPADATDNFGNPMRTRGHIFRLMHREHMASYMREVDPKDPALAALMSAPARVPQTTARTQRPLSPFPPIQ